MRRNKVKILEFKSRINEVKIITTGLQKMYMKRERKEPVDTKIGQLRLLSLRCGKKKNEEK